MLPSKWICSATVKAIRPGGSAHCGVAGEFACRQGSDAHERRWLVSIASLEFAGESFALIFRLTVFAEQKSKKSVQEATDANVSDAGIEREFVSGAGNATGPPQPATEPRQQLPLIRWRKTITVPAGTRLQTGAGKPASDKRCPPQEIRYERLRLSP